MRTYVLPGEAPQYEAQTTVGVQADGDLTGGIELTLQLDGATQSTDGCMGHLINTHTSQRHHIALSEL